MRVNFIFILILFFRIGEAQNLVPNYSFEDTIHCPIDKNNMEDASEWMTFGDTPDYYNSCNTYPATDFYRGCSVPSNWAGFQWAATGVAYVGLINGNTYPGSTLDREYIGIKLSDTLRVATTYYFSFKVSPAYKIYDNLASGECFSNNIGIKFSTRQYSQFVPPPTDNVAHFHYTGLVNDTSGWLHLTGSFISDSAYTYLILGNFFDNQNTQITCDSILQYLVSYLYIDDVCVSTDSSVCGNFTTSIQHSIRSSISIYPNPATDYLIIEGVTQESAFHLSDLFGREVFTTQLVSGKNQVETKNLTNGIYIYKVTGELKVGKVFIKK